MERMWLSARALQFEVQNLSFRASTVLSALRALRNPLHMSISGNASSREKAMF